MRDWDGICRATHNCLPGHDPAPVELIDDIYPMLMDPPFPIFKFLAQEYKLHGPLPSAICRHNAMVGSGITGLVGIVWRIGLSGFSRCRPLCWLGALNDGTRGWFCRICAVYHSSNRPRSVCCRPPLLLLLITPVRPLMHQLVCSLTVYSIRSTTSRLAIRKI